MSLAKDSSGDGRRDTWRKGAEREEIGEGEVKRSTKTDIQYSIFDIRYSIFNCFPSTQRLRLHSTTTHPPIHYDMTLEFRSIVRLISDENAVLAIIVTLIIIMLW